MAAHLARQHERLNKQILTLGALVEESVQLGIKAVETRDAALAQRVIRGDNLIDAQEIEVEEECLHTLALYQPVASDLRFVVALLKINTDLERVADLSVNIAEGAEFLASRTPIDLQQFNLPGMYKLVQTMLRQSLDALVNSDAELARQVRLSDLQVDSIHRQMYQRVSEGVRQHPDCLEQFLRVLNISRQLERIGDHAVNIAEDVVYMTQGDILRHASKRTAAGV